MKDRRTNKLLYALFMLLFPGLLCCTDERESYNIPPGKEKTVTFSVKVPGSGTPSTYALSESDENKVGTIEILLFDSGGNYTYRPIYSNTIVTSPIDNKIKTFTVKVPEGTYDMVILANARQILGSTLSSINIGDSKVSVLNKLLITKNEKWNADPATSGYIDIPMWGEITSLAVSGSMAANNPVTLVRMLAKIDVVLTTQEVKDLFKMWSVRLYNYNDKGSVAPYAANWNAGQNIVTAPSVPASAQKPANPASNPYEYSGFIDAGYVRRIYTFEATAGNASTMSNNTCLVIGGFYDGKESYYRVDFAQTTETTTNYLPLLRNHHYKVNITDIKGPGFSTPKEAFNARPVNIEAEIISWNDAQITDIVFDGQYMLGVSKGEITLPRQAFTASSDNNTLSVTTDYPAGWKVEKIVNATNNPATWLSVSPNNGPSGATTDTKLIIPTENTTGSLRTAFVHLSAGRLTYIVKVNQDITSPLELNIRNADNTTDVTELVFVAGVGVMPAEQKITLSWILANQTVEVSKTSVGNNPAFVYSSNDKPGDASMTSITEPSGQKQLTIQPMAITAEELKINPFLERISKVEFKVSNGTDFLSKSIFFSQINYNLVLDANSSYRLDGSTYTFHVKSNMAWRIKSVTEQHPAGAPSTTLVSSWGTLKVGTVGGYNTITGDPVSFTVKNTSTYPGKIKVVFESTDNPKKIDDVEFEFGLVMGYYPAPHSGWAGSNIYYDSVKGNLTFDDVGDQEHRNYQGVHFKWGSLYGVSPVDNQYLNTTILYHPSGGTTSGIVWDQLTSIKEGQSITNDSFAGKNELDRAYLYEVTNGDMGIGDICKYLTEKGWAPPGRKWRMPTSREFESESSYSHKGVVENLNSDRPDGTFIITNGLVKNDIGSPFFPASRFRMNDIPEGSYSPGQLGNYGVGSYWSSSPSSGNHAGANGLWFNSSAIYINASLMRSSGFSVRCVVE